MFHLMYGVLTFERPQAREFVEWFYLGVNCSADTVVTGLPSLRSCRATRSNGCRCRFMAVGRIISVLPSGNRLASCCHWCLNGSRSEERRVGKECRSRWSPDP